MFRKLIGACVGLAIMGMAGTVNAAIVSYSFTGHVTSIGVGVTGVAENDPITGSFSYDTTDAFDSTGSPGIIRNYNEAIQSLAVNVGPYSGSLSGTTEDVLRVHDGNVIVPDELTIADGSASGNTANAATISGILLRLTDSTRTAFDSGAIPESLSLAMFDSTYIEFTFTTSPAGGSIAGEFDSLTIIPIPAALPLMGTGLAVLGLLGWRRRRAVA